VSTVQAFPSSQSASTLQQLATCVCAHVPPGPEQVSAVQGLASSQSASVLQHPAIGENTQRFVARLQVSLVHASPSVHCASETQQLLIRV
jgi:hypothetical protein